MKRTAVAAAVATWLALDRAYQDHHFQCPTCKAAGKGVGTRCATGAALWAAYIESPAE